MPVSFAVATDDDVGLEGIPGAICGIGDRASVRPVVVDDDLGAREGRSRGDESEDASHGAVGLTDGLRFQPIKVDGMMTREEEHSLG